MKDKMYYCRFCLITTISNEKDCKCKLCNSGFGLSLIDRDTLEERLAEINRFIDKVLKGKHTNLFGDELVVVHNICTHVKRVINR